ncbi:MAG TPA: hypothetical protein VHI93_05150 [Candidatus Thermoplasmatota archaeon]|nr:hypothetical protein [Candidatus Thermoplasmatota archaeon]
MRALLLAGLLAAGLLAGCIAEPDPVTPPAPARDPSWAVQALFGHADPHDSGFATPSGHDHTNRSQHLGLGTPNFEVLGQDPLRSPYFGASAGTSYCGDVAERQPGKRQLAVVQSLQTDVALTVLDVTDRARPAMLGELVLPYVFTYDSAIFADGRYAVIAGNPDLASDKPAAGAEAAGSVPFQATWRTPCGERAVASTVDRIPYGYSAILVDLADPANPKVADFYQYPGGRNVHSISTATVDGTRYVATSGLAAVPCTLPSVPGNPVPNPVPCEPAVPRFGNALSHFDVLTVQETPAGARLALHLVYTPRDQAHLDPSLLYLSNGHTDATIEKHPVTNQTLAYLADWDGGLHIIRLDGPGRATPLASWGAAPGGDATQMTGNMHSVWPVPSGPGEPHYLLVGQEIVGRPAGRPSGQVAMLDVTDPTAPVRAFKWTLPVEVQWGPSDGLAFSTHYPILVDGTLFVAMYHGGVWAANASRANWPDLPSVGAFLPAGDPAGTPFKPGPAPEVLEVLSLGDGALLVYDGNSGAYTVRFHRDDPRVPPALPWPENPWMG